MLFILVLISCQKQETEIRNYGFSKKENSNLNVSVKLLEFENYGMLMDRIREITCNDSIPKIAIVEKDLKRNMYPISHCEPMIFDPDEKHYVSFHKGKFYKDDLGKEIGTDSLSWILKNDFEDFKVIDKSDAIKSYFIIIQSNRNEKVDGIGEFLTDLTQEFDKLKTELELNISFWEIVPYIPPEIKNEIQTE